MKIQIAVLLMMYSLCVVNATEIRPASADEPLSLEKNGHLIGKGSYHADSELSSEKPILLTNANMPSNQGNILPLAQKQLIEPVPNLQGPTDPIDTSPTTPNFDLANSDTFPPTALEPSSPAQALQRSIVFSPEYTPTESAGFFDTPLSAFWWGIPITIFVLTIGSVLLIMRDINKKKFQQLLHQNQSKSRRNSYPMAINPHNPSATTTVTGNKKPANQALDAARQRGGSAQTAIATATVLNPSTTLGLTPPKSISSSAIIDPAEHSNDSSATMMVKSSITPAVTSAQTLHTEPDANAVLTPVEPALPAIPQPPYSTTNLSYPWKLFGISKQGHAHLAKAPGIPCQDSHHILAIDEEWGVVVVCDGAGSQAYSQYGAAFVAKEIAEHLAAGIPQTNIYKTKKLPSEEAWNQYCKALVLQTRKKLEEWIVGEAQSNPAIEGATIRDVGCTLIWTVYTPMGLLTGHVGDGRAGYRDAEGWHAMMTPWEGEYSNQTVFINTDSIYVDQLENQADSSRPFLESSVIVNPNIDAFVLMSDGCESGLYETVAYDAEKNANVKINRPHAGVCDNIIQMLKSKLDETSSDVREAEQLFTDIVEEGNTALKNEGDDKTLVLCFLSKPPIPVLNDAVQS